LSSHVHFESKLGLALTLHLLANEVVLAFPEVLHILGHLAGLTLEIDHCFSLVVSQ
jgi:hypothetical protein